MESKTSLSSVDVIELREYEWTVPMPFSKFSRDVSIPLDFIHRNIYGFFAFSTGAAFYRYDLVVELLHDDIVVETVPFETPAVVDYSGGQVFKRASINCLIANGSTTNNCLQVTTYGASGGTLETTLTPFPLTARANKMRVRCTNSETSVGGGSIIFPRVLIVCTSKQ